MLVVFEHVVVVGSGQIVSEPLQREQFLFVVEFGRVLF